MWLTVRLAFFFESLHHHYVIVWMNSLNVVFSTLGGSSFEMDREDFLLFFKKTGGVCTVFDKPLASRPVPSGRQKLVDAFVRGLYVLPEMERSAEDVSLFMVDGFKNKGVVRFVEGEHLIHPVRDDVTLWDQNIFSGLGQAVLRAVEEGTTFIFGDDVGVEDDSSFYVGGQGGELDEDLPDLIASAPFYARDERMVPSHLLEDSLSEEETDQEVFEDERVNAGYDRGQSDYDSDNDMLSPDEIQSGRFEVEEEEDLLPLPYDNQMALNLLDRIFSQSSIITMSRLIYELQDSGFVTGRQELEEWLQYCYEESLISSYYFTVVEEGGGWVC